MVKDKKFIRSKNERIIAGVAGGVAKYFGMNPSLIRVIFVVAAFVTEGLIILIYIVMILIVPEEKNKRVNEIPLLSTEDNKQSEGFGSIEKDQQYKTFEGTEKILKKAEMNA